MKPQRGKKRRRRNIEHASHSCGHRGQNPKRMKPNETWWVYHFLFSFFLSLCVLNLNARKICSKLNKIQKIKFTIFFLSFFQSVISNSNICIYFGYFLFFKEIDDMRVKGRDREREREKQRKRKRARTKWCVRRSAIPLRCLNIFFKQIFRTNNLDSMLLINCWLYALLGVKRWSTCVQFRSNVHYRLLN